MARPQTELLLKHIERLAGRSAAGLSDAELLGRFLRQADAAAFTAIVQRHGAMVWQVSLSAVGQHEDAEDLFQATFLVLARQGHAIRKQESLACWLHGVALRLARKLRGRNLRHQADVATALDQLPDRPLDDLTWRELRHVLHQELGQLPEKNQLPILLCHLQGRTQDEAARELGWSLGRLRGRLLRGRELLRQRLTRRGLAPAVPLLAGSIFGEAAAAAPEPLVATLAQSVAALASHESTVAAGPLALAERFLHEATRARRKAAMLCTAALLAALTGIGVLAYLSASPRTEDRAAVENVSLPLVAVGDQQPLKDQLGDPLPAHALLRLGTLRFRYGGVVRMLAFARDGKTLTCCGWDNPIRRWDTQTGAEREPLEGFKKGFIDAAVAHDGKTLVGGTVDGNLHVWDLEAGKEIKKFAVPGGKVIRKVALASDGRTAAVAGDDNVVRLVDLTTGAVVREVITYKQQPTSLAFSPDGKVLASASYDDTAHVHDAATGKELFQLKAKKGAIYCNCFTPDGKTLLAGEGNAVSLWDAQTGQMRQRIDAGPGSVATVQSSTDGKKFAAGTLEGMILIWDTATLRPLHKFKGHADNVQTLAFSPDGASLASGGSENGVHLWDTATGKQIHLLVGHQERVTAVAVAPGGKLLATVGWDHCVRLWDADKGKEIRRFDWKPTDKTEPGMSRSVHGLVFSPDGKILAAAGYENKVWLWNLENGQLVRTFDGIAADFSPDGKLVATADWTPVVRLYETATGKEVRKFEGQHSGISEVKFTPDGLGLITVNSGAPIGMRVEGEKWDAQTIWLWDLATARVRRQFGGQRRPHGLAVSPDGRTLCATGLFESKAQLWELATGKQRAALTGHGETIFGTAFSPDGKVLASGSMDLTIRLWQLPGGAHAGTFEGHRGWVLSLAFFPDGKKLVSGSLDTTAIVWQMPAAAVPQQAKLAPAALQKLWDDLASDDAGAAYQAIAVLAAAPGQAVPMLQEKLRPAPAPDLKLVAQWIADLDSQNFATRQKATAALESLAELAEPHLRLALEKPASLEAAQRIGGLLESIAARPLVATKLRDLRAVEVLEFIGTAEARAVLQPLSQGAAGASLTRDAQAALRRLGKQR